MAAVLWNSADNYGMTLSNGDLDAEESQGNYVGVRATQGLSGATKRYIEFEVLMAADAADIFLGFVVASQALNSTINGNFFVAWRGSGTIYVDGGAIAASGAYNAGDTIVIAVDIGTGKFWCAINGSSSWIGGGDPAAGTLPTGTYGGVGAIYPFYKSDNITTGLCKAGIRGALANQQFAAPSGFSPWSPVTVNPHIVGKLTQLHPQHATGSRYGSFLGRTIAIPPVSHPVPILTQLHPQHATGGRYGSFRRGAQPTPPTPAAGDKFIFVRRSAKRLRDRTRRGCRVIR